MLLYSSKSSQTLPVLGNPFIHLQVSPESPRGVANEFCSTHSSFVVSGQPHHFEKLSSNPSFLMLILFTSKHFFFFMLCIHSCLKEITVLFSKLKLSQYLGDISLQISSCGHFKYPSLSQILPCLFFHSFLFAYIKWGNPLRLCVWLFGT